MKIGSVDNGRAFDFGKTAAVYAAYRNIYPKALFDRLRALGVAADGTAWLDLGTGTGVLPRALYGPAVKIVGVDISEEQIAFAKREAEENGWDVAYLAAPAEATGLPDRSFDAITAAQCFWYFDREKMRGEIGRLLKPGGIFVKILMDWDRTDAIADRSVRLVERFAPDWTGGGLGDADMLDDLFPGRQTEVFFADLPFTRESWHGRMCACRGTLASMEEKTFRAWEEAHLRFLARCPEHFTVRHRICLSRFILE